MNESVTFEEFKAELDQLGRAEDIAKSAPGVYNLLQVACEMGLPKHLEAMLKIEGTHVKYKTVTFIIHLKFLIITGTCKSRNGKTVLVFQIFNIFLFSFKFFYGQFYERVMAFQQ